MEKINKLALAQQEVGNKIQNYVKNMKKDAASRKTAEYIQTRSETIDTLWEEAQENHKLIVALNMEDHNYITTNFIDQIKGWYTTAVNLLDQYQAALDAPAETVQDSAQAARLKRQSIKIEELLETVMQIQEQSATANQSRGELWKSEVTDQWKAIHTLNEEILVHEVHFKARYFIKNEFKMAKRSYEEAVISISERFRHDSVTKPKITLPQIQIPVFGGGYEYWPSFRDVFVEVIHTNQSVSRVEKMQYLKTYLKGEASKIIQHLAITEDNYELAWGILKERYNNNRLIFHKVVDKLLDMPVASMESAQKLKQIHDNTIECLEAIHNLGVEVDHHSQIIGRIISRKFDEESKKQYEQAIDDTHAIQDLDTILKFLKSRFQALEVIAETRQNPNNDVKSNGGYNRGAYQGKNFNGARRDDNKFYGPRKEENNSFRKDDNNKYNGSRRDDNTRSNGARRDDNTRSNGARRDEHRSNGSKRESYKPRWQSQREDNNTPRSEQENGQNRTTLNHVGQVDDNVILATALVHCKGVNGTQETFRVLMDPGSQASFITEDAAQTLGLPREKVHVEISGLGSDSTKIAKTKIDVNLKAHFPSTFNISMKLLVLPKLTQVMPQVPFEADIEQWHNHKIADPIFNKPAPIDILIGAKEYGNILEEGFRKTEDGLWGLNSKFGWLISGSTNKTSSQIKVMSMITRVEEDKQLTKFWEIEETGEVRSPTQEDEDCEKFFEETTERSEDGIYTVRIPFKHEQSTIVMGDSKSRALSRFFQLEKRLIKNDNLYKNYREFMQDYIKRGHMTAVPANQDDSMYYIPHQAVIKESSTTTKLRVVFDASCKTSDGKSLNDLMHTGPRLQQELTDILLRWRTHKIAFSADIEKMYRQIKMNREDQKFQRILWRNSPNQPIKTYNLETVTYGTAAAPYLAVRTLQQLARDESQHYPIASKTALRDFYVDDILSGADTIEEAHELQDQLIQMCKAGGLVLRKWSSNSNNLIDNLPEELKDQTTIEFDTDDTKKSLGIHWSPIFDSIKFKVEKPEENKCTKRFILSEVAKIFDPLGWLAPVVILAKLLIQELWTQQLEWDQQVPEEIKKKWDSLQNQLKTIEEIVISRWIHYNKKSFNIELHGFCDASEKAYGAVIYSKTINKLSGQVHITLLTAKSKVAPAKNKTTLPRLELCAAVLLAKLMQRTRIALEMEDAPIFAWSDSMITIAWIKGDTARWKTFVANRVAEINKSIPHQHWYHVKTEDNPADAISRGLEPSKIKDNKLWWTGPSWLQSSGWQNSLTEISPTLEESKKCNHVQITTHENDVINRFSSFEKMTKVIAYCNRFIQGCRKQKVSQGCISYSELQNVMRQVTLAVQTDVYKEEIKTIVRKNQVDKNNKLANLSPFLDKNGILRVGGRLQNSQLSYNKKHPIIIPSQGNLTKLIVQDAHAKTLHGGTQLTLTFARRNYWIVNGKKTVSSLINKCITCTRYRAQAAQQQMGNLPAPRITPSPPFTHTGVDYAGPIQVRATKGRGHKSYKGYIAVFVCLATKAVHLEVVSDMSTETFLAAMKRFTSRRGHCAHMYSDNGTNFVGASNLIQPVSSEVEQKLASDGTQWHFNPPAAPHFGGIWEAGVKSMKHHLKRIIGDSTLTFEELTTLIYQIEGWLNSRPLCPLSNDINDVQAITPAHFLIGREIISSPEAEKDEEIQLSARWKLVQKMKKHFWNAWSSEYLQTLQQRYKWKSKIENMSEGDLVIIKEDNVNPSRWPLARIQKVHPDKDGIVRVVTLKKAAGSTMKRAIHNVIPIPTESEDEDTDKATKRQNTHVPKIASYISVMMILTTITSGTTANYTFQHTNPGLYVEHIGQAKIDRGSFRIEIKYDKEKMFKDFKTVATMVEQMENICKQAKKLTTATQCSELVQHLQEQEKQVKWIEKGMIIKNNRMKRGLLGKLMTSVFGVNDEVYEDIDTLNKNQHELIKTANHQTKIMISTVATFNETEQRIYKQMSHFQEKLKQGLSSINKMQMWFASIDHNKLAIQVLSTYQVATNCITEIIMQYTKVLELCHNQGSILSILSPAQINEIINEATRKLPTSIQILSTVIQKNSVNYSNKSIHILGYFAMTEMTEYTLLKVTPVPLKIENGSYWILDTPSDMLAVDYNNERYFQLKADDLKESMKYDTTKYICSPLSVQSIENNPNCIIDEIYQRSSTHCDIKEIKINERIIWKQVHMRNTWQFISNEECNIAITCNGEREDVRLNKTGLIQISPDCVIITKENTITPKRNYDAPTIAGFSKHVKINISTEVKTFKEERIHLDSISKAGENLNGIINEEHMIKEELENTPWKTIHIHAGITSGVTVGIISGMIVICWTSYKILKKKCKQHQQKTNGVQKEKNGASIEMVPLKKPNDSSEALEQ